MKIGEDVRISLRSIKKRPVESLLLILGVALGIGATAAGVSMITLAGKQSKKLLSSTNYREILVSIRETAEDMELPAVVYQETDVVLTTKDLRAREDVPELQYAYTSSRTRIRLGNFNFGFGGAQGGQGGQAGGGQTGGAQRGGQAGGAASEGSTPRAEIVPAPSGDDEAVEGQEAGQAEVDSETAATTQDEQSDEQAGDAEGDGDQPAGQAGGGFFNPGPAPVVDGPQPVLEEVFGYRVTPEFFSAWELYAAEGSLFSQADMDQNARLLVLGSELAPTLFEDGESLGRELLVQRQLFTIAGILEPTGTEFDTLAFMPERIFDISQVPAFARQFLNATLHFTVFDSDRLDEAKAQLTEWFDQTYGTGLVTISIPREEAQAARERSSRLVTVILFLAIAGLLIASVNVSNILLGRAMRKRKNVGILKALGATIRDVFGLFFIEAIIIGAGGAALGAGVSLVISRLMDAAITGGALVTGMLFSVFL